MENLLSAINDILVYYKSPYLINLALRFILQNPFEALIITDSQSNICFLDKGSEKLLGLKRGEAFGVNVNDLIPDTIIPNVIATGTASVGRILNVNGVNKISSTFPLKKDGNVVGALGRIILHSLEEIDHINKKKKELRNKEEKIRQRKIEECKAYYTIDQIFGNSPAINNCIEIAKKIAMVQTDVLITGESGTGKELFAQAIHNYKFKEGPFVRVNCTTIPFEIAESELFGYERGAFSGAKTSGKEGKFEAAEGGTIFLDEISSMPLSLQGKLLRVIQEREIEKIGSTKPKSLNFRLIAATNVDLKKEVKEGKFRKDLYYRIARTEINVPPLRNRTEDINEYLKHFINEINKRFGTSFKEFSKEAKSCLIKYNWPGNVRELINVIEQSILKEWDGEIISFSSIPNEVSLSSFSSKDQLDNNLINKKEIEIISETIKKVNGNKSKAARILNIPRSTLYSKLKRYKIDYL